MPRVWTVCPAPTSLTTGVTLERLNAGTDLTISDKALSIIECVPAVVQTGAFTAGQSHMIRAVLTSDSIATMVPKEFVSSYGGGGIGTFIDAMYPALKAFPLNVAKPAANTPVRLSGQAQVANTVAPEMYMELTLSEGGPIGPEQYYIATANETSTGTTATGEVAGGDITINARHPLINMLACILTSGTPTVSESLHGRGQIASNNFVDVPSPQVWLAQPTAMGLATSGVLKPSEYWKNVAIPGGDTMLINTALQFDEAQTAAGNFIIDVAFYKNGW